MDREESNQFKIAITNLSKSKNVSEEFLYGFFDHFQDILGATLDEILNKAVIFSRWSLAGSVTGIFTILMQIKELLGFYNPYALKLFIIFQIASIFCGCIFLFNSELRVAFELSYQKQENLLLKLVEKHLYELKQANSLKADDDKWIAIRDKIKVSFKKILKVKFLVLQLASLLVGLGLLINDLLVNLF